SKSAAASPIPPEPAINIVFVIIGTYEWESLSYPTFYKTKAGFANQQNRRPKIERKSTFRTMESFPQAHRLPVS
ncbi:MAG: hypothetical protein WBO68_09600, partial [Pyrinomonadaceae bacterium]